MSNEQERGFETQGLVSGMSMEDQDIGLFGDNGLLVSANEALGDCMVCRLPFGKGDKVGRDLEDKVAHWSCIRDQVAEGGFDVEEVEKLEKLNNVSKNAWLARIPEVRAEGCGICSHAWQEGDRLLLASRRQFAHRPCVEELVRSGWMKSWDVRKLADLNGVSILDIVPGWRPICKECGHWVGDDAVCSLSGGFIHKACLRELFSNNLISEDDLEKTCSNNGIFKDKILEEKSAWDRVKAEAALISEAQGKLRQLWDRFTGWLTELKDSFLSLFSGYDKGTELLEQAASEAETSGATVSALRKEGIDPEVQRSMNMLAEIERVEQDRKSKLEAIARTYQVTNLSKSQAAAAQQVKGYVDTLRSKQRRFSEALFRLKEVTHRGVFQAGNFRAAIKAAYENDAAITEKIAELEAEATKPRFTSEELEVVLETTPEEVAGETQELQRGVAPQAPAPRARARRSVLEEESGEELFD